MKRRVDQRSSLPFFVSKKCRGIVSEYLPWILIALSVLAIVLIAIFILKGKGISLIDQIKNLFSGR